MLLKCTVQMDFNIIKQVHLFYYSDYMYATSSNSRGSKISGQDIPGCGTHLQSRHVCEKAFEYETFS